MLIYLQTLSSKAFTPLLFISLLPQPLPSAMENIVELLQQKGLFVCSPSSLVYARSRLWRVRLKRWSICPLSKRSSILSSRKSNCTYSTLIRDKRRLNDRSLRGAARMRKVILMKTYMRTLWSTSSIATWSELFSLFREIMISIASFLLIWKTSSASLFWMATTISSFTSSTTLKAKTLLIPSSYGKY